MLNNSYKTYSNEQSMITYYASHKKINKYIDLEKFSEIQQLATHLTRR